MFNCITIDVGSWDDGYNQDLITSKIKKAIVKKPKEIYITGNFSKWVQAMEENDEFAFNCLIATFNKIKFTDDGGNNKIYSIYQANIFCSDVHLELSQKFFKLKKHYSDLISFLNDVQSLELPVYLLKTNKLII